MLEQVENLQFFDIETVSQYSSFEELEKNSPEMAALWIKKYSQRFKDEEDSYNDHFYTQKASLYPEFSKIICMTFYIDKKLYTFQGEEVDILKKVYTMFEKSKSVNFKWILSGFNIKQYDIPFIFKRYVINGLNLPKQFNFEGLKPWEINIVDVFELWKSTSYTSTSLETLSITLGVSNPKILLDDQTVHQLYYEKKDNSLIKEYCEKDCVSTKKCYEIILKTLLNLN